MEVGFAADRWLRSLARGFIEAGFGVIVDL
ncbi:hypothetical protein ENSA7_38970 [Enhygromyxa salina]|uniref:Uncharacterized protein n=1 Tax=Enhygromyxa salina TaxID=215803 RepID=A0A2S9YMP9_9BACT|nr:hypothetical protein ENSA7_38970 [Enhygromyxa salina]